MRLVDLLPRGQTFLEWNRSLPEPHVKVGYEMGVYTKAVLPVVTDFSDFVAQVHAIRGRIKGHYVSAEDLYILDSILGAYDAD